MNKFILGNFIEAKTVLEKFTENSENLLAVEKAGELMVQMLKSGNKIISCGNGGSMSDAMHFAEELTGRFRDDRRAIPAIAISDSSHLTCVANDYGFDAIFSRFVEALGQQNDVLLCISTSGNSENCVNAALVAKNKKMKVVALTGKTGGKLAELADVEIRVAHSGYSDRIQEVHIKIIHTLIQYIETYLE